MNLKVGGSWLKNWRAGLCVGLVAGFLIGLFIFGAPWHLPPAWGDIPTWLLVVLAAVAGWVGLDQLRLLRKQVGDAADEAEARGLTERRKQAEDIDLQLHVGTSSVAAYVLNKSRRPVTGITCKLISKAGRSVIAQADKSSVVLPASPHPAAGGRMTAYKWEPVSRWEVLRPRTNCGFLFDPLTRDDDHLIVVWFTDDAGFRWQLDENMHLVEAGKDDAYLP